MGQGTSTDTLPLGTRGGPRGKGMGGWPGVFGRRGRFRRAFHDNALPHRDRALKKQNRGEEESGDLRLIIANYANSTNRKQ